MVHAATEHLIKIALYVSFTSHFLSSALSSGNGVSVGLNLALLLGGLWAIGSELLVIVWRRKLPPGTLGIPIFGDILRLLAYRGNLKQMWMDKRKEFGSTFLTNIPPLTIVTMGDEEGVRWLWMNDRKQYTQVAWPPSIAKLLGPCALANANGTHHKEMRRIMEPFFAPTFVRNYMTVVDKTTQQELQKWAQPEFLSSTVFKVYALRLFLAATFDHVDEESLHDLSNDMHIWLMGFITLSLDKRIPGMAFDRAMKARDRMLNRIDALVKIFAAKYSKDSEQAMHTIVGRMIYAADEGGKTLTYQERQDNLLNLLFAGHDTTYASISTVIHYISKNPDIEKALVSEVSSFKVPLDFDELKNAPVLNAVMYEAWRIDPPVGGAFRKSTRELSYKDYIFPKGSIFQYQIILASNDDQEFRDASTEFKIQRFLPLDHPMADPDWFVNTRGSFPVFGGGSHVCLGRAFAHMELRILLTNMYANYIVEVRNDNKVFMPINCWSVDFRLTAKV